MKWNSAYWIFATERIVAQLIMQLMSDESIFTHVCEQTVYTLAAIELLNSIDSC